MLNRNLVRGFMTAFAAIVLTVFPAAPALADTMYFTYNSAESGDVMRSLNDAQTGTLREYSVTGLNPGQEGFFSSPAASFYSKPFPDGNAVAIGDWTMYAWGKAANPSKVVFSPEIGEYTSSGNYNILIPHGDAPAGFGWTPEYIGGGYELQSVTKAGLSAFTLSPGSRLYVRVWVKNIHKAQQRDGWLATDTATNNSRLGSPAFAKPIPSLGWYLTIGLIIIFMGFAVRFGAVKLRREKA